MENLGDLGIYKFIDNYEEGKHCEKAFVKSDQLIFVLDGQQRLTSLLIGLRGSYTIKKKHLRYDNPNAWITQQLYFDLLKDPKPIDDSNEYDDDRIYYGFKFFDKPPEYSHDNNEDHHYWFNVGEILGFEDDYRFQKFKINEKNKLPGNVNDDQKALFEMNLNRLHSTIWKEDIISYYVENNPDYDRAMDIFVRTNEGGTKLTKSDVLLSMVISKWEIDARKEIYGFMDRLNTDLSKKNNLNKDFIMKACLVLSDLPVKYEFSNFNKKNLQIIEQKWMDIKDAIEKGVKLVNDFGIDRDTLTSANALIPIIYYIFLHKNLKLQNSTTSDVNNVRRIRTWLSAALINNVFGGQSDQVLTETRRIIQENHELKDYPVTQLNEKLKHMNRNTEFDEATINDFLQIKYNSKEAFLALSLLYDFNDWGTTEFQQDHIFPKFFFNQQKMVEMGISSDRQKNFLKRVNCIGNLELLRTKDEHPTKGEEPPEKWIRSRDPDFKVRHLIPADESVYAFDRFDDFLKERERLIRKRLENLFSPKAER
jgi:hypothetical protein